LAYINYIVVHIKIIYIEYMSPLERWLVHRKRRNIALTYLSLSNDACKKETDRLKRYILSLSIDKSFPFRRALMSYVLYVYYFYGYATVNTEWITIDIVYSFLIFLCFFRGNRSFNCCVLKCWKHHIKVWRSF